MRDFLLVAITLIIALAIFIIGININEVSECEKLQEQARQYPEFFLTQWQAEQCKAHAIPIDAPIKR